jgi:uncharacterized protein
MPAFVRIAKGAAALFMLAALSAPARAGETAAPAAPPAPPAAAPAPQAPAAAPAPTAPAAAAPGVPSPAAVAAADKILGAIGVKESIALVVPGMMAELEANVTRTRPEIKGSLRATLKAIQPEFDKTARQTYDEAATLLASLMSEKELTDVAAFFDSPSGKKYVTVTPVFLQKLTDLTAPWREKLSTDIVTRARQEMKKKGVDF